MAEVVARGVAVVALDGSTDDAWALAIAVYGDSGLRPASIDDARARILAGEPPPETATTRLRELSELRAAVHGDDAPSRRILGAIAGDVGATSLLVVSKAGATSSVRLFTARTSTFDPEVLPPPARDVAGHVTWLSALDRTRVLLGLKPSPAVSAAPAASMDRPAETAPKSSSVFSSPWLWGALGAAAVVGVTTYLLTRHSTSTSTYELHGRVDR